MLLSLKTSTFLLSICSHRLFRIPHGAIWVHILSLCSPPPLARSYSAPEPSVYNPWRMNIQETPVFSCFVLYKPVLDSVLCTESIQYNQIMRDRRILFILDVFTVWSVFTDAMWWVFSIYIHFTVLLTKYFNVEYSMLQFLMPKHVIICLLSCLKLFCNHYFVSI